MGGPESTPTIKYITDKLNGTSIRSSWTDRSPAVSKGSIKFIKEAESRGSINSEKEAAGISGVKRKKDFKCMERVNGRLVNVLEGLELHTGVFNAADQKKIVEYVYALQEEGRKGRLRERTYSEPRKWMRGKGRVTLQFGCCYNYATDKNGNPPGIIRDEQADPIPPLLKSMIKRMVEWRVLPPTCIPNSCIINIYDKDDCIPPHIDHHDFVRPFCTVSFLSECNILFGAELKVLGPGDFSGSTAIPLPLGSVLILSGNGADVAKHCVPAVPSKRISITFRKMDDSKLPFKFTSDPELQKLRPLPLTQNKSPLQNFSTPASASVSPAEQNGTRASVSPAQQQSHYHTPQSQTQRISSNSRSMSSGTGSKMSNNSVTSEETPVGFREDDFPSLGSNAFSKPLRKPGRSLRQ